ncbi:hypothetical protein DV451_004817 [Geotrichum candidum]|uniref:Similar to Saccharomyces cerevisiae YPL013C MRPS16 Mitochondrial ribosomal protein of the small subunit n=1 Tax=Geotrichum candidum TaxID=1173061 RepID=A0A0J9X990_GEOCN|nr:hypothetical protein DV451_004817 [Geotrichum candidum]KAI9210912.1 hypothetical protein DS838_004215 [Geotrichum bryndzae]KAF5108141.1 hypothetical protein DV453_002579 [Geotrichum candidum]KAF5115355.1 hypothetical protein DV452_003006 [Geotrichum candidum]KAF5116880.1 hypothetical protein DV454_001408 [Geotrichum candidum]
MKGSVRIRLARFGRKFAPVYNIVVARARTGRNNLPIEVIGTYNPIPEPLTPEQKAAGQKPIKDIRLDFNRSKYWIGVGAQPTDTVARLFRKAGILHPTWPAPHVGPTVEERKVEVPAKAVE